MPRVVRSTLRPLKGARVGGLPEHRMSAGAGPAQDPAVVTREKPAAEAGAPHPCLHPAARWGESGDTPPTGSPRFF